MNNVVRVEDGKYLTGQGGSGGSGGHTIQNDSGTALPQESALQFVGVYSEDDSTNGKTKVNIIREMTKAQMDALSTDAKKGVIHTTDEPDNPTNTISADDVSYGSGTVEDVLDNLPIKIYKVTGTTGALNEAVNIPAPSGATPEKLVVIGFNVQASNGYWYSNVSQVEVLVVTSSTIRVKASDGGYASRPIVVLIAEYA